MITEEKEPGEGRVVFVCRSSLVARRSPGSASPQTDGGDSWKSAPRSAGKQPAKRARPPPDPQRSGDCAVRTHRSLSTRAQLRNSNPRHGEF